MSDAVEVSQVAVDQGLPLIKFIAAFALVICGMLALAWVMKRAGLGGQVLRLGQKRRLTIVESLPVDHRRRLVLLRRDDREHLVLLGPEHTTVIETAIVAPAATLLAAVPAPEEENPRASA